jgi:hypothetical protein
VFCADQALQCQVSPQSHGAFKDQPQSKRSFTTNTCGGKSNIFRDVNTLNGKKMEKPGRRLNRPGPPHTERG